MTDNIFEAKSSNTDRTESGMDSGRKRSPASSKQSSSSREYSESEIGSKSSKVQNDSEHSIGSHIQIGYSKFDNKSERQLASSSLIQIKIKEHCFSDKNEKKQDEERHSPEEEKKKEVNERSENYVDQCLKRPLGETLEKNFDESKSKNDKEFEQAQLERDSNRISNLTSQNVLYSDDKSKYVQKLNKILDSKRWDKVAEKLDIVTLENQVREIKNIDHVNLEKIILTFRTIVI